MAPRKKRTYSESDKKAAALATLIHGSSVKAAKQLKIPGRTIRQWYKGDDWPALLESVRAEFEEVIQQKYSSVINASLDQLQDRIFNGDYAFNKQGELVRKPMSGKDLSVVNGISYDKLRLSLGQPTTITANADERIKRLLSEFGRIGKHLRKQMNEKVVEGEVLESVSMAKEGEC